MGRYFKFHRRLPELHSKDDLGKIREYLEFIGNLSCSTIELCRLWGRFSASFGTDWLTPNVETLEPFAEWLAVYNEDLF